MLKIFPGNLYRCTVCYRTIALRVASVGFQWYDRNETESGNCYNNYNDHIIMICCMSALSQFSCYL